MSEAEKAIIEFTNSEFKKAGVDIRQDLQF